MLYWLIDRLILPYILSSFAFLMACAFNSAIRQRSAEFLNYSNLIAVFILMINFILILAQAINCKIGSSGSFSELTQHKREFSKLGDCFSFLILTVVLGMGFHLLFFKKKFRVKISYTFVSILLLLILVNFERITVWIRYSFQDYLPSSWSTYDANNDQLWTVVAALLYFAFCWFVKLGNHVPTSKELRTTWYWPKRASIRCEFKT